MVLEQHNRHLVPDHQVNVSCQNRGMPSVCREIMAIQKRSPPAADNNVWEIRFQYCQGLEKTAGEIFSHYSYSPRTAI